MFGWFKPAKKPLPKPALPVPEEEFTDPEAVLDFFTTHTGIHFKHKESIVTSKLAHFCRHHQIYSFHALHSRVQSEPLLRQELINYLTVNETYFFREVNQIDYMVRHASHKRRKIRILCAPGSTGEEPYSIAISLREHNIPADQIEIVSIDINSEAIDKARAAVYNMRSLHKTAPYIEERYFLKENGNIRVSEEIRRLVRFHIINVFDNSELRTLGAFDYIFSRNMLIYFEPSVANQAIQNLSSLARSSETLFFFGHADIVNPPSTMKEHHDQGARYYTIVS